MKVDVGKGGAAGDRQAEGADSTAHVEVVDGVFIVPGPIAIVAHFGF